MNTKRLTVYDWVRFLATVFIVIAHSTYLGMETTYGGVAYEAPANLSPMYFSVGLENHRFIASWVSLFVLQVFFMVSGAMLAIKPLASFTKLVKGKAKRLLVPYFLVGWLYMLPLKKIAGFYDSEGFINALRGFITGEDSGHLWFLPALFWGILALAIILKVLQRLKIESPYAALIIAGVIYFVYDYLPFDVLELKSGLSYLLYITIGYVFEIERQKFERLNLKNTLLILAIVVILEILDIKFHVLNLFAIEMVGALLTYIVADLVDRAIPKIHDTKVWKYIIRNIFYVYLFHDPLNYLILEYTFKHDLLTSGAGCIFYTLLRTIGVFVVSLAIGELVVLVKKYIGMFLED
ncbi:Acyltransferase family protein [Pseudobutyrivibrio ruminis]|uniref:Acyltransferase family protein n=1 Tax=Pseudobutyrivibrio ruminis TaxID=46206 RepID=A0A1H7H5Y0_9FIRM|nr:acyltransferase [Pseudobutyrivibrio ruminis]SEK44702.1 Acyltransferase family protein [Pseudobutyrivibrio ruminis]